MRIHRNAQGLTLGLPRAAGAAAGTLTTTLQSSALLQDLHLNASQLGLVDAIRVAGQNVMCSDKGMDIQGFSSINVNPEGHRGIGIPLASQQTVAVDYTLAAAGTIAGGVNVEPIDPALLAPVNTLGQALNYCAGFGSIAAGAGATTAMVVTMRRQVMLGLFGLTASANSIDLTVRSISINNVELNAGAAGQAGEVGFDVYSWRSDDTDGNTIGYQTRVNDQITIQIHNYNAAAIDVYGGAFILPDVLPPLSE